MFLTQTRWHYAASVSSSQRVNQKLLTDSTQRIYGSLSGEEQRKRGDISSRNTPIDLCASESTVIWLTSNTIKWKQEGTEDHHYINHQSFPRLPPSIICADDLMSFVPSETIHCESSNNVLLAQRRNDRKEERKRKKPRNKKLNWKKKTRKKVKAFFCFHCQCFLL